MKLNQNKMKSNVSCGKMNGQLHDVWVRLKRNKASMVGLVIISLLVICAVFAGQIAPYGYDDQVLTRRLLAPSKEFILGTDNLGRDIFSRIIYGGRISLQVGVLAVAFAASIGVVLGAIAGFYGKKVDNVIMRIIDIVLAIPSTLLAISIAATLGSGMRNVMIAIGIGAIPSYARIVRASVLSLREQEFVEAARSIGASDFRIVFFHILPNCIAPIIVQATTGVASAILSTAALSFVGLGVQPPIPEWGSMLSSGRDYIRDYWWIVTFPGVAIMLTIFSINLFGDGLRDALDPKLKN